MRGPWIGDQQARFIISGQARGGAVFLHKDAFLRLVYPLRKRVRIVRRACGDNQRAAIPLAKAGKERVFQIIAFVQGPMAALVH